MLIDRCVKKELGQPERGSLRVQNRFEFFVGDFTVVVETIRFFDHLLNILLDMIRQAYVRDHAAIDDAYLGDMFTESGEHIVQFVLVDEAIFVLVEDLQARDA